MLKRNGFVFLLVSIVIAAGLWTVMFSPATMPYINFWGTMCVSAIVLLTLTFFSEIKWWRGWRLDWKSALVGVVLAAGLWAVFWIGDIVSSYLFDFARPQVDEIYGIRSGISPVLLSVLLLFLIGPAEEIFWRGYVQKSLSEKLGKNAGVVVATLVYAGVHIPSWNFMLVMASLVAGAVWGCVYRFRPEKFGAVLVSHALWDAAVFVWFPL